MNYTYWITIIDNDTASFNDFKFKFKVNTKNKEELYNKSKNILLDLLCNSEVVPESKTIGDMPITVTVNRSVEYVKVTLTTPKDIRDAAKSAGLNLSEVLTRALKKELNWY